MVKDVPGRHRKLSGWRRDWPSALSPPDPVHVQPHMPPTMDQLRRIAFYAAALGQEPPKSAFDCRLEAWCWLGECWDAEVRAVGVFSRVRPDLAADWESRTQMVRAHREGQFGFSQATWDAMVEEGRAYG